MNEAGRMVLIWESGTVWAGQVTGEPDLLLYCQDGVLACSQVQVAAASAWLAALLSERVDTEESRIQTVILPFASTRHMTQVLELMYKGSVVLQGSDVDSLVNISSLLGCTGDMQQEPLQEGQDEERVKLEPGLMEAAGYLITKNHEAASIQSMLDRMHAIQQERFNIMLKEEREKEEKEMLDAAPAKTRWSNEDDWLDAVKPPPPRAKVKRDEDSLSDFIVDDSEEEDDERRILLCARKRQLKRRPLIPQRLVNALSELGESIVSQDGANVICGLCDKAVPVPMDMRVKGRVFHFKKYHFNRCSLLKGDLAYSGGAKLERMDEEGEEEEGKQGADEDSLEDVYRIHLAMKEQDNQRTTQGRKKADLPPLETIRTFLKALGGAVVVNRGHQVKCGLCSNKLRVNSGRTIMGNIRYFERTHLVRCPARLAREGKPTELISENFIPGRTHPAKVLKAITIFDTERGDLVSQLMSDRDIDFKRLPGRPRRGEVVPDRKSLLKKEYYMSKRKQALAACLICFHCKILFNSGEEVEQHNVQKHPDIEQPFYCLACQATLGKFDEMMEHLDTDHNYKPSYACPVCTKDFPTQSKLNKHMSEQHPDQDVLYNCNMCHKGFVSFNALKIHQKSHLNIDPTMQVDAKQMLDSMQDAFNCRFCSATITYGKQLDDHMHTEHQAQLDEGNRPYHCHLCSTPEGFEEFYFLERHLREHGVSFELICRFCLQPSLNRNKFVDHFKTAHSGVMPYECPRYGCDKNFSKKQKLQDHLVLHRVKEGDISEDMQKLCNECGKVFYIRKKLEQHVRLVHGTLLPPEPESKVDKEKKHQCHLCAKAFSSSASLEAHVLKHENNPCFMCDHCGKGFYRKDRLAVHTRSVHLGMKNFQCDICQKKFIDSYKLRRHIKTHTSGGRGGSGGGQTSAATAAAGATATVTVAAYEPTHVVVVDQQDLHKLEPDEQQHQVVVEQQQPPHHIVLHVTQPTQQQQQHQAVAKRTTIQNYLKFEVPMQGEETLETEATPVDFTQHTDTKLHTTQYHIINATHLYQT